MQIVPNPNVAWANPAAASQQASSQQRGPTNAANADTGPRGGIHSVERSSETSDRDANGQYDGSGSEQHPKSEDERNPLAKSIAPGTARRKRRNGANTGSFGLSLCLKMGIGHSPA